MPDLFENPMGLMGFEFVEFASPTPNVLEPVFEMLGFSRVAQHRSKDVTLYRQGDINFIVNREPRSVASYFAAEHGPSACGLAFRVKNARLAFERALELGAQPVELRTGPMELHLPAIKGIGGAPLYLIDRFEDGKSIYDIDFEFIEGVNRHPQGHGLRLVDHMTHNVYRGRMAYWARFYEHLFNFREIRFFDIKGEYTGLTSKAMTAPDGKIRIPLNEEASGSAGQIEEFLLKFNGEGIQHIALLSDDIFASVDSLRRAGVPLMGAPPAAYYKMLSHRLPGHGEPVNELQTRGILLDGSTDVAGPPQDGAPPRGADAAGVLGATVVAGPPQDGAPPRGADAAGVLGVGSGGSPRLLLQIFSKTLLGPVFFEFIQRKGDDGFGEGNFKALFDSLERDQIERGIIQAV